MFVIHRLGSNYEGKGKKMLKKRDFVIVLSTVLLVCCIGLSLVVAADDKPKGDKGKSEMKSEEGMRMRPRAERQGMRPERANFQDRQLERTKRELGVTDEEWTAIEPKVKKVMELSSEVNTRGMAMMSRMRPGQGGDEAKESELQKASTQLREVLQKEDSAPEDITAKLTAYRAAKKAAEKELAVAQAELKKVLNIRQEAKLVMMGTLD